MLPPIYITILFLLLIGFVLFFTYKAVNYAATQARYDPAKRKKLLLQLFGGVFLWMILTAGAAMSGFLTDFTARPPRLLLVLVGSFGVLLLLMTRPTFQALVHYVPKHWIIYSQAFRIPLEVVLWWLYLNELIPIQMTFEGYNFDIISGVLAVGVGFYYQRYPKGKRILGVIWNILGASLVFTIVGIAAVSVPGPLRIFNNEPANRIIACFPYVWLPTLLVTYALLAHWASLQQFLKR
ncbi:MAG: hypothetical protein ACFB0B_09555 [Thermonemataceae bacterium]